MEGEGKSFLEFIESKEEKTHLEADSAAAIAHFQNCFNTYKSSNAQFTRFSPEWVAAPKEGVSNTQCRCYVCNKLVACRRRDGRQSYNCQQLKKHLQSCTAVQPAVEEAESICEEDKITNHLSLWQEWVVNHGQTEDVEVVSRADEIFFRCISEKCKCKGETGLISVLYNKKHRNYYVYNYVRHRDLFNPKPVVEAEDTERLLLDNKATIHQLVEHFKSDGIRYRKFNHAKNITGPFLDCSFCDKGRNALHFKLDGRTGRIVNNIKSHVASEAHIMNVRTREEYKGGLLGYGFTIKEGANNDLKVSDFVADDQQGARMCHGFSVECLPEVSRQVYFDVWEHSNTNFIGTNYYKVGGEIKLTKKPKGDGSEDSAADHVVTIKPLFKSLDCEMYVKSGDKPFANFCCTKCSNVKSSQPMQRLVARRVAGPNVNTAFVHEFRDWELARHRDSSKEVKTLRAREAAFKLSQMRKEWERQKKDTDPTAAQIIKQLSKMERLGCHLPDDDPLTNLLLQKLQNQLSYFRKGKKNGYRHSEAKGLATAVNFASGGLAASGVMFHRMNYDITRRTVQSANAEAVRKIMFREGIDIGNIEYVLEILHNGKGDFKAITTLLELSWDESPNIEGILASLNDEGDKVLVYGYCGEEGKDHKCFSPSITIHNKEEFLEMIGKYRPSNNISAIMFNPVTYPAGLNHKTLKSLPLFILPTCNTFKKEDVYAVLKDIYKKFHQVMKDHTEYKFSLIGFASDGDKRRVSLQDFLGSIHEGRRGQWPMYYLRNDALGYGGRIVPCDYGEKQCSEAELKSVKEDKSQDEWIDLLKQGKVLVEYLSIQDPLHVIKKLFNSIDSLKNLYIGSYAIDANIIRSKFQDNVISDDLTAMMEALDSISFHRKDSMDVSAVQKLISLLVQEKLVADDDKGLRKYLDLIWKVRMIFLGVNIPLETRIEWCGYCIEFLFGWYYSFEKNKKLNSKDNFITLEAFRDTLTALNYFINLVRLTRDTSPESRIDFARCGTNCCEDFFSLLGRWGSLGGQARGELFGDMLRTTKKLFHQILEGNKNSFSRNKLYSHEQSEMVEDEKTASFDKPFLEQKYNLQDFTDAKINELINAGRKSAKDSLKELGVSVKYKIKYSSAHFKKNCMSEGDLASLYTTSNNVPLDAEEADDDVIDSNVGDFCARTVYFEDDDLDIEQYQNQLEQEMGSHLSEYDLHARVMSQVGDHDDSEDSEDSILVALSDEPQSLPTHTPASAATPVDGSSSESKTKINLAALPSKTNDGSVLNLFKACYIYNRSLLRGKKKHKERDLKIIQAALQAAMKTKKGGQASTMSVAEMMEGGISAHVPFQIGSYVCVMFIDEKEGVRLFFGKITGMTNRPSSGKGAAKWRVAVKMGSIPATLYLRCSWFLPYIPSRNPDKLTSTTTPFYYWDASEVVDDNVQEFQAKFIVKVFEPLITPAGLLRVPDDVRKDVLKFRLDTLEGFFPDGPAGSKTSRKRKRERKEEVEVEVEVTSRGTVPSDQSLTHTDIEEAGVRRVLVTPGDHPATIAKWEEVDDESQLQVIDDATKEARPKACKYFIKYDTGACAIVDIDKLIKPPAGKRVRRKKQDDDYE